MSYSTCAARCMTGAAPAEFFARDRVPVEQSGRCSASCAWIWAQRFRGSAQFLGLVGFFPSKDETGQMLVIGDRPGDEYCAGSDLVSTADHSPSWSGKPTSQQAPRPRLRRQASAARTSGQSEATGSRHPCASGPCGHPASPGRRLRHPGRDRVRCWRGQLATHRLHTPDP